jgi:hypothetical protein
MRNYQTIAYYPGSGNRLKDECRLIKYVKNFGIKLLFTAELINIAIE